MSKIANPDHPAHDLITKRWSPYGFSERPVDEADLRSVFEAARWAASAFNEQPWRYIVATREDPAAFERLLECLVEANRAWAKAAPVLVLGMFKLSFAHDGSPNAVALHDLGLAAGNLSLEATARGLSVHQMAGILPDRARELYGIPEDYQPVTAIAIGYAADAESLPDQLKERDTAPRQRKPLSELVFGGEWGSPSEILGQPPTIAPSIAHTPSG